MRLVYFFMTVLLFFTASVPTARGYYNVFTFFKAPGTSGNVHLIQDGDSGLYSQSTFMFLSFSTQPIPGDFVWVSIVQYQGSVSSVTDNQGNTYTQAFAATSPDCAGAYVYGYYALNVSSSGTFTVEVVGSQLQGIHIREYSGLSATNSLDQTSTGAGIGAAVDSGPITTFQNGELYIAAQSHCSNETTSAGAGWTHHVVTTDDNNNYQALSTEDRIGPPGGIYDGTFNLSASDAWLAGIASFK